MNCQFCFKDDYIASNDITLSDGSFVHLYCYEKALNEIINGDSYIKSIEKEIQIVIIEINSKWKNIDNYSKNFSLARAATNFLFGKDKEFKNFELNTLNEISKLNELLRSKQTFKDTKSYIWKNTKDQILSKLTSIYDYWPTYPPDWNTRKSSIRNLGYCSECFTTWQDNAISNKRNRKFGDDLSSLQVHHIRPLKNGGSNKQDNLVLVCNKCHEKIHGFSINSNSKEDNAIKKNQFVKKIDLINLAIKEKTLSSSFNLPKYSSIVIKFYKSSSLC